MRFIVTGATGYIGSRLISQLYRRGHTVFGLSRNKPENSDIIWVPYDLADTSDKLSELFIEVEGIIHLAATTSFEIKIDEYPDINAAIHLVTMAKKANTKFVFISSQTARADAPTDYGRFKWMIEQEVLAAGGLILRPGQVYGGEPRGLFGKLIRLVKKIPVLPAFCPELKIQPIHVDDLAQAIVHVAEGPFIGPDILCLGAVEPISFTTFLSAIAINRLRCRRLFLPVPTYPIKYAVTQLAAVYKSNNFLNQLNSLFNLPEMKTDDDIEKAGISLRPLRSGMHPSGDSRRRHLILEGRSLIGYILQERPQKWLLRRYVRAVESLSNGRPLNLPDIFINIPVCLALLDIRKPTSNVFYMQLSSRLDIATALAEATPQGAVFFLGVGLNSSIFIAVATVAKAVTCELFFRFMRFVLGTIIDNALKKAHVA